MRQSQKGALNADNAEHRTWDPVPKLPSDAKWETYAPQGSDKWSGATDWVSTDVPTKLLRWICMARGIDAGGSGAALVERLQDMDSAVERAEQPSAVQMRVQPPSDRFDSPERASRRCHVLAMGRAKVFRVETEVHDDDDYDMALGMVVQIAGRPASAGFDTFAEASAIKKSMVNPN